MARKKATKPPRELTKHQLSRWQKQKKRQRIVLSLGILIIVAALSTVGVGWYLKEYLPLHEVAIRVNNTEFNMNYFIERLRLSGKGQAAGFLYALADGLAKAIEQDELLRQGAEKLGVSVSDDALNSELRKRELPSNQGFRDMVRTELLVKKLLDEYFDPKIPVFTEQRQLVAIFLESEGQANEVRARLEKGEDWAELASELSLESESKSKEGDLGWRAGGVLTAQLGSPVVDEYAFSAEVGKLSSPIYDGARTKTVGYWLIKVAERKDSEAAHVYAILSGSAQEAQTIKDRLEAGEDFATLARELSQHSSREDGGDLSWLTPGMMSPAFEGVAFDPKVEVRTLSKPIRDETAMTQGGYWLIKVVEIDANRKIADEDRALLKSQAFEEWFSSLVADPENKIDDSYLTEERKAWAVQKAQGG